MTGQAVLRPFGSSKTHVESFNAFHLSHLPLPRAVGPYTVVCTTAVVQTTDRLVVLGSTMTAPASGSNVAAREWSSVFAYSVTNLSDLIVATDAVTSRKFANLSDPFWKGARMGRAFTRSNRLLRHQLSAGS